MKMPRSAKIFLAILVSYYLLIGIGVSFYIKSIIPDQAKNFIHGDVSLESFWINPLTNSVHIKQLRLSDLQNQTLLEVESIYVNLDVLPLILMNAHIGKANISGLKIYENNQKTLLGLDNLTTESIDVSLNSNKVTLASLLIDGLSVNPQLNDNGSTNIEALLEKIQALPKPSETIEEKQSEQATEWQVILNKATLTNSSVSLRDLSAISEAYPSGAQLNITNINLNAGPVYSNFEQDMRLKLSLDLLGGQLNMQGSLNPSNKKSMFEYELKNIQLAQTNAYINKFTYLLFEQGLLNLSGTLNSIETPAENDSPAQLQATIQNALSIMQLVIKHQGFDEQLLNCNQISNDSLKLSLHDQIIDLNKLLIDQCLIKVSITQSKNSSADILKKIETSGQTENESTESKTPEQQDAVKAPWVVSLVEFNISNNSIHFKDSSAMAPVEITIDEINALVGPVKQGEKNLTQVSMNAIINKNAKFNIKGNGNFVNEKISSDITVNLDKLGLKTFSPYMLGLSGRPITKGVLNLEHKIKINENKLDSHNMASIENLTLGKKQDIEGASKLPIALAITLLRNNDGVIEIDVPVYGDLDDPDFSIRKQVIKTLTGIITKAASAPFTMVGGLVPGSDTNKAREIPFALNTALLPLEANKKIEAIAKALIKNPELGLELTSFIGQQEVNALAASDLSVLQVQRIQNIKLALLELGVNEAQLVLLKPSTEASENGLSGIMMNFFVL